MTRPAPREYCTCGHGAYHHGNGATFIGKILGYHSRCDDCDCAKFERDRSAD